MGRKVKACFDQSYLPTLYHIYTSVSTAIVAPQEESKGKVTYRLKKRERNYGIGAFVTPPVRTSMLTIYRRMIYASSVV